MVVWLFCSGFNSVMTINDRCMVAGAGEGGGRLYLSLIMARQDKCETLFTDFIMSGQIKSALSH